MEEETRDQHRFNLFGVVHKREHFDTQVSRIEEICDVNDKAMMLELAPNYEANIERGILQPNFFVRLAERYRPRCSKVILGDQELTIPENPDWLLALVMGESYCYPENRRDEIMKQIIERELPDIVIVGNGHSNEIKEYFPKSHYIVFQLEGGYTQGHHGRPYHWYRPDEVINLTNLRII